MRLMEEGADPPRLPEQEGKSTTPLKVSLAAEDDEVRRDDTGGLHSSPESPSRSSRELRASVRAFTSEYYRDMNTAPSRVRRYYTVRRTGHEKKKCNKNCAL